MGGVGNLDPFAYFDIEFVLIFPPNSEDFTPAVDHYLDAFP
jgi:hypothetical protein